MLCISSLAYCDSLKTFIGVNQIIMQSLKLIALICINVLHVLPGQSADSLFKHVDARDKVGNYFEIVRDDFNKLNHFPKEDNKQR